MRIKVEEISHSLYLGLYAPMGFGDVIFIIGLFVAAEIMFVFCRMECAFGESVWSGRDCAFYSVLTWGK